MTKEKKEKNELAIIEKQELSPIEEKITSLKIVDLKTMTIASEFRTQTKAFLKKVIDYKEKKTKPLNDLLKVIRGETKPLEVRLEGMLDMLDNKMSKYQTEAKRAADEEAAKIATRVGEGKGKLKAETAIAKMNDIDRPESNISTESGGTKFRTDKKLVIDDEELIPRKYIKEFNTSLIKSDLVAGVDVPGCHIEEVQIPVNSR